MEQNFIDIEVWSSVELKKPDLTFIRKGRLKSSSYSTRATCLSHSFPPKLKGGCQYHGILLHRWEYQVLPSHHSNEMVILSMWRASRFGGKEQPPFSELAISSPSGKTFFSINDSRSAICGHRSVWVICLLYFHETCEGTCMPKLAKARCLQNAGTFVLPQERYLEQITDFLSFIRPTAKRGLHINAVIWKLTFVFGLVGFCLPHWIPSAHNVSAPYKKFF